jgi:amino acid adenylation domain-containing protein
MKLQSIPDVLTLFDVVHYRASEASGTADASAFTYMDDGDHVSGTLSFAELDLAARKLAARLQRITKPGDRVLLVYSPSLDYIIAFYGCVYAGVTAVPALPPANRRTLPRLRLMAADSQPVAALTLARIRDSVMNVDAGDSGDDVLRQIPWLSTDDIDGDESTWVRPEVQASDIVFLQYTSGSTGTPKGVMVAHHNLLANLRLFRQMFDVRVGETFVFWLPPHHDFGLIGSIIMPVFAGAHCVQFPPAAFMMSPVRWLRLISRYRARLTGAPNFAYQLCVDKISEAQMQGLDLSCLDVAMNGAERIRFETVTQFTEKFATCGFRRESMMPSYGMAEFVLLATADMHRAIGTFPNTACISKAALEGGLILPAERSHDAVHIVSVGRTHEELHALAIVDPVTLKRKGDQQVGEVWLCGPSVSHGYWRQDAAARQQTFCARMAGDEREWLRTGDVGFVSKEELFITGRSKEVMIFSGRNIYPQDVEITVERASPAFRANGCSAFSLEDGNTTQLVVVQEVESRRRLETEGLIARLRADIAEQHEIFSLAAVILVRPGHVPRTSSGKIQRVRCRQMYLAGEFDSIWSWCSEKEDLPAEDPAQLRTSTELRLLELWRGVFGNQALLVSDNFFHLGGHSLLAAQLVAAVGAEFHVDLPLRALFEAPSVASLASLVDTFQPRETAADELLSSPQGGDLPLSFAQQRFWFLDHYQPANAFYAVPVAMRLSGKLVLPALWQALDAMVQRHAVLRTIFPVTDGVPSQRVLPSLAWPLLISDVGDLDADGVDASIRHAMMEETRKPFDLARGPLIRAHLLHIGTEQHVLLLTLHHIVHDGWSVGVLIDELAQAYAATKEDQKLVLPALPVSYADYTQWERRRYDKQNIRIHLSYWIERLRGASPLLALPTDRPRPTLMSHRGATHVTSLSGDLVRRLAERAGQHNATLFMALTAGIQILLHRYCGQDDICMSVLSANRPAKTESMIGVFVNVVPLRAQFSAGQVFADALAATRQEVLSAYERQLPFELIINQLVRERHAAYTPYAQVVLNFHSELERRSGMQQHWIEQSLQFDGRWAAGVAYTAFDLLLDVRESHGGLEVVFEYSTDLFEEASIQRLETHLRRVLDHMAGAPNTRIDEFSLLDVVEHEQVVETFNATAQTWEAASLIHQLFESRVERQPDAIALVSEEGQLSYGSLNRRANQLAHTLIAQGIRPDDRVALYVERSAAMVVGLLGILKAGGAYVPVDPDYPPERVSYMLGDSQPRLLLSSEALRGRLPQADVPILWLDDPGALSAQPDHNPDPHELGLRPDHLAYVIYTSGSTGQPKGAMNQHDGVVNRLLWAQQQFALDDSDRVLQKTPYAFDVSVWEFFLPLLAGAQLVLARPGGHKSPTYLAQWMGNTGITVAHFVPSMLQVFLEQDDLSGCRHLRHVLCSGEALPPTLQDRFLQKLPGVALHNLYGPTEAAVDVTYWPCVEPGAMVPIGRPIANTQLYVLDARMQPVPIGVAGELYIGGVQVGRGYLHRPTLTEERFVANPFGAGRLYKTGDLGRWRADGAIEYLGRNDFQVKLRGLRIELGEIEAALSKQVNVRDATVIVREDVLDDKRMVAYVTAHNGQPLSIAALRDTLAKSLPDYMLPSAFVQLAQLPLTPNGKLDRRALPAPDQFAVITRAYEPAQGELEHAIAAVWQELLGLERVGRHDHFFELGGHSLQAVQMTARLREQGWPASVKMVFASPVLAALAVDIAAAVAQAGDGLRIPPNLIPTDATAITPMMLPLVELPQDAIDRIVAGTSGSVANIQDIYPLSPLQEGMLFHYLLDTEGDAYLLHTMLAFEQRSQLDAFVEAMQQVIDRHDVLRTAVHWQGLTRPVQVVHRSARLPVEELDLPDALDIEAELLAYSSPRRHRLDLSRAPLLRAFVVESPCKNEWLLALLYHHLVIDHVTLEIMVQEIHAILQHQSERLPHTVPYRNFIAQTLSVPPSKHEAYFRERLGDIEEPTCLFGVTNVHADGHEVREGRIALEQELSLRVREAARRHGVSAAVLFHVAWAQLLSRCTGQDDVVFGTVLAGRSQDVEASDRMLGLFINTLPLRVVLAGRGVRQVITETYYHLRMLLNHEQSPLSLAQRSSGVATGQLLFNSLLNYRHGIVTQPAEVERWQGLRTVHAQERNNYPVTMSVDDLGDSFGLVAHCSGGIDPLRLIDYTCEIMHGLVGALYGDAERSIHTVGMLTSAERYQVVDAFNAKQAAYPAESLIHQLFEQQVLVTPDAMALLHEGNALSYGELNRRANQVAHTLIARGIKPGDRVALGVDRSLAMVIGILGILKAGAGYVPLAPSYPAARLAYLLEDSAPALLLTQTSLPATWPHHVPVLHLDVASIFAAQSEADPQIDGLDAQHLAYVIYTSGSTGKPKGVMVTHRSLSNYVWHAIREYLDDSIAGSVVSSPLSFDATVTTLLPPLLVGKPVVLFAEDERNLPQLSARLFAAGAGWLFKLTPAHLDALSHLSEAAAVDATGMAGNAAHCIVVGGEQLSAETLRRWKGKLLPAAAFVNEYGPTEATVGCSVWRLSDASVLDALEGAAVPIGSAIANARMYLLDRHGDPVPVGVTGEIHIGGPGVALGYWNRPKLTDERFLPDPFVDDPHARMYKSGDLARWLPDGQIEYLGRSDFQVKIRGFRIEPGEIEAKLLQQPNVRDAVVVARTDALGDKRLVAYLTSQDGHALSVAALRDALAEDLAEFMLPSAFVELERLPLTSNGKLDRQALPAPDQDAVVRRAYEAPQGEMEQNIAALWQELLGLERVGRHDHFFELGGHSLMIITMIARLRDQGYPVNVKMVFSSPSLSTLAAEIATNAVQAGGESSVPPNLIPADGSAIVPAMLPLVELTQDAIDRIADGTQGGAANIQDIYPLSPLQEGLLFHHLMDAQGDTYLLRAVLAFERREQLDAFLGVMQQVIERHDVLRSAVHWQGLPRPIQVVHRKVLLPVEELQLAGVKDAEAELLELTDPRLVRLDLSRAPLLRAFIARNVNNNEWLLALWHHHIVCDHVTLENVAQEIQAIVQQRLERLPPPMPYRNFIAQTLRVPVSVHEAYFRERLGDVEQPTCLFDIRNVHDDGRAMREVSVGLDHALALQVRACASRHDVSAAVLFHVAWAQVLARCTGQDDVVFGTVLAGRSQGTEAADRMLGLFINTLPLRIVLADRSVRQVVEETYHHLSTLLIHEQAPLALAQRCSGVPVELPLFNSLLNYRHSRIDSSGEGDLWQGVRTVFAQERTNYPISLSVDDLGEGFGLVAQCVGDIDPARLIDYTCTVMHGLIEALRQQEERPIHTVGMLGKAERHQVLEAFNATATARPTNDLIHRVFEAQVAARPDAIALICSEEHLSYGELNQRANQVAYRLMAFGLGPDDRVAVCTERGPDRIIGMLGILKAGAAYVPLDPAYPAERLAFMLQDSAPVALLTQSSVIERLPAHNVVTLMLDEGDALAGMPVHNPDRVDVHPEHLAYVIYTSGSTGRPKGVMNHHAGLYNLIAALIDTLDVTPDSGVLHAASCGFDASVLEMMLALGAGASLHVPHQDKLLAGAPLQELLASGGITHAILSPVVLASLPAGGTWGDLHTIIAGGDVLPTAVTASWAGSHRLFNGYGPTEATVCVTVHRCIAGELNVPIGRPIANARIYLLDRHGEPVPVGVIGEIYIGGVGVARGYLHRADLSAERFLPDPFVSDPSAKMYRSGDLGRWLPNGEIEFLGRIDLQVKIRGFRIELGEIEAALRKQAIVHDAVVIAREDVPGDKCLVAYFISRHRQSLSAVALRDALAKELADYMMPSAFVQLEQWPLTPNGKLDRHALPLPDRQAMAIHEYEAPRGEMEQAIATIWQALLGLQRVGRNDHFFQMGGHSLHAVLCVSQLRQGLGVDIPLRMLFSYPTVAELVSAITQPIDDVPRNITVIRRNGAKRPLFLVHSGGGEVAYAAVLAPWLDADMPLYAITAQGLLEGETPLETVYELAERCIRAMRRIQPEGPYRIVGYSAGGVVAYEIAYQLVGADAEVEFVGLIDTNSNYHDSESAEMMELDEMDMLRWLLRKAPDDVRQFAQQLAEEGDHDVLLRRVIQHVDYISHDTAPAYLRRTLAVLQATGRAIYHYVPSTLPVPVTLFSAKAEQHDDPAIGWGQWMPPERLHVVTVNGSHTSLMEDPHIRELGQTLSAMVAASEARGLHYPEMHYQPRIDIQTGMPGVTPLFCIPGAGDSVAAFHPLSQALSRDIPMYGLQPRGLDGDMVPYVDVDSAARAYVRAIKDAQPIGPYQLLGHSFGGWVAFEIALQLAAIGDEVAGLYLLDSRAPREDWDGRVRRLRTLMRLIELYDMRLDRPLPLTEQYLRSLTAEQQIADLHRALVDAGLLHRMTPASLLHGVTRVMEANLATDYVPEVVYPGRVHLLSASDVQHDAQQRAESWRQYAPALQHHRLPGNHVSVLTGERVVELGRWLNQHLIQPHHQRRSAEDSLTYTSDL